MEPLHAPGNPMIYVLEGHALKHAVEEMLLHLVPAEIPAEAETVPKQGDFCVSRLHVQDGTAEASAEVRLHGVTRAAQRTASVAGLDALGEKRVVTEIVKLAIFDAAVPGLPENWNGEA